MRALLGMLAIATLGSGCFSDAQPLGSGSQGDGGSDGSDCTPGALTCDCVDGTCLQGLTCQPDLNKCVNPSCEGANGCVCRDGTCDADLSCVDGICRDGSGGSDGTTGNESGFPGTSVAEATGPVMTSDSFDEVTSVDSVDPSLTDGDATGVTQSCLECIDAARIGQCQSAEMYCSYEESCATARDCVIGCVEAGNSAYPDCFANAGCCAGGPVSDTGAAAPSTYFGGWVGCIDSACGEYCGSGNAC